MMSSGIQSICLILLILRLPFKQKREYHPITTDYHRQIFFPTNRTLDNVTCDTDTVVSGNADDVKSLNNILQSYNRKLRPNRSGPATHVRVEFKVVSFGPVMESNQMYSLEIFFRQWWEDPTLIGVVNTTLTLAVDPSNLFWIPDTYFVNGKHPRSQDVSKYARRLLLKPDGSVYYSSRLVITASCPMDFTNYPMDKQICPLIIESYAYTTEDVYYTWYESEGNLARANGVEWVAADGPDFKLTKVKSVPEKLRTSSKGTFSSLQVDFHLSRKFGLYIWNVYMPSAMLVLMTWIGFWIPAMAYPARVTVLMTSFLATMVIMSTAGTRLGCVSYVTAMDYFLFGNLVFLVMAMVEYVAVLHMTVKVNWLKTSSSSFTNLSVKEQITESNEKLNTSITSESESRKPSIGSIKDRARTPSINSFLSRQQTNDWRGRSFSLSSNKDDKKDDRNANADETVLKQRTPSTTLARTPSTTLTSKQSESKIDPAVVVDESKLAHTLDVICRFIFPVWYLSFIAGYCAHFGIL